MLSSSSGIRISKAGQNGVPLGRKRVKTGGVLDIHPNPPSARLLKTASTKAAGSVATEAYPCGTSQGDR